LKRKPGQGNEIVPADLDDDRQPPDAKRRRRLYSHDIANKINTILEPVFEEIWTINKDKERELAQKVADEIRVEIMEALTIVKAFWHRTRGNTKRLFTQLDDYRLGLEIIRDFDPEKKREAIARFRLESEEVVTSDLNELPKILDDMKRKGSSRTAVKGKKTLSPLPDGPIKTLKGRASALGNYFYELATNGGNLDDLGLDVTVGPNLIHGGTMPQPLMSSLLSNISLNPS